MRAVILPSTSRQTAGTCHIRFVWESWRGHDSATGFPVRSHHLPTRGTTNLAGQRLRANSFTATLSLYDARSRLVNCDRSEFLDAIPGCAKTADFQGLLSKRIETQNAMGLDKSLVPASTFKVIQFASVMKSTFNRLPG